MKIVINARKTLVLLTSITAVIGIKLLLDGGDAGVALLVIGMSLAIFALLAVESQPFDITIKGSIGGEEPLSCRERRLVEQNSQLKQRIERAKEQAYRAQSQPHHPKSEPTKKIS